jgi:rRNA small subunit pseudouridine methyltransferase Nep1
MRTDTLNVLIVEDASLEILPPKFRSSVEAKDVTNRFGVPPHMQILDWNFHSKIVASLNHREKRGRPDVVHLALLDATSTPLFKEGLLELFVRTSEGFSIQVKAGTRLPRTLERFCGVMAKLLSGKYGDEEKKLFAVEKDRSFRDLTNIEKLDKVISFSSRGSFSSLRNLVANELGNEKRTAWIVGGFPHGHFSDVVIELSDMVVSISRKSLPAHVVTARLCYELETNLNL